MAFPTVPGSPGQGCTGKPIRLPCLERKRRPSFACPLPARLQSKSLDKSGHVERSETSMHLALTTDGSERTVTTSPADRLTDKHGRNITDLRVAITDRCNYKCVYCRTGNDGAQYAELPFTDYFRMARIFVSLGIEKIRLTGGEPL